VGTPIPGVIFYVAFSAEEVLEDVLVAALTALLRKTLSSQPTIPTPEEEDEPPVEDPGPDSWEPNAHDPWWDDPVPDDQDSEEPSWDTPSQPEAPAGSSESSVLQEVGILILIVLALVIIALLSFLAGDALIAISLWALAALGVVIEIGGPVLAAAALLIVIVRAMLKRSGQLSTSTSQVFSNPPEQVWADVAATLSSLGGLSATDIANLHVAIATAKNANPAPS
jgi:hypothetical protein